MSCTACDETGFQTVTDWVPYGSTNVPMLTAVACPHCLEQDLCPRCDEESIIYAEAPKSPDGKWRRADTAVCLRCGWEEG